MQTVRALLYVALVLLGASEGARTADVPHVAPRAAGARGTPSPAHHRAPYSQRRGDWRAVAQRMPRPEEVRLVLDGRPVNLRDDLPAILAYFRSRPPDEYMAEQLRKLKTPAAVADGEALRAGELRIPHHPPTPLPDRLTWSEDPFKSTNWQFWLHGLHFFEPALAAYQQTGDAWYLNRLHQLAAEWMHANVCPRFPSTFSWHDQATAFRIEKLLLLFAATPPDAWNAERLRTLLTAVYLHGQVLAHESFYSRKSNHGLDQSYILLWTALYLPEMADAPSWRDIAASRLRAEFKYAFSSEGVHVENSPSYHRVLLTRLMQLDELSRHFTGQPAPREYADLYRAGLLYLTHAVRPDGMFPIVGDTQRTRVWDGIVGAGESDVEQWYHYASSQGRRGVRPPQVDAVFPRSGYAVFRDDWHPQKTFADTVYLFYKCGYLGRYHRHDDDNSFLLYGHGEDWIIDSGLFTQDENDARRAYVRSDRAHNVATIAGVPATRDERRLLGRSVVASYACGARYARVTGVSGMYTGFVASRTITYEKPDRFNVADLVVPRTPRLDTYRVLFHVPDDKRVEIAGDEVVIRGQGAWSLVLRPRGGAFGRVYVVRAQEKPELQGWVSWTYGALEPAQCVVFETRATWLGASIDLSFVRAETDGGPELRGYQRDDRLCPPGWSGWTVPFRFWR